jgi:integrase
MKKVWLEHMKEQKVQLFRIGIIQSETTLIFGSIVNTNLDSGSVLKELKKVYASIGITDKTFHDLRHTYATRLFELGEPAKTVQELLGHSNTAVTLNIYTHVLGTMKVATASKIDDLYKNKKPENEILWGNCGKKLHLVK